MSTVLSFLTQRCSQLGNRGQQVSQNSNINVCIAAMEDLSATSTSTENQLCADIEMSDECRAHGGKPTPILIGQEQPFRHPAAPRKACASLPAWSYPGGMRGCRFAALQALARQRGIARGMQHFGLPIVKPSPKALCKHA